MRRRGLPFFHDTSSGYYQIKNVRTLKCLTIRGDVVLSSAPAVQMQCTLVTTNSEWKPINRKSVGGLDYYRLQNRRTGLCLDTLVPAGAGTQIKQISCNTAYYWTWRA
ncbi:RICIN domain-containing protein [Kineosporia rhizophila]|uniref:RICIN domain-containing protein n=1 Tax=Kineosporia rhizophila TaxID=84633 RepID=UPI000ADE440E|nr:RICIN domain-containing protein [Kineosporia rhizophila]MCE0538755.1 RICIN domain-containing protein [Kineosporia rhizophila]